MGTRLLSSKFLTSTILIFSFALLVVFPYSASAVDLSPTVEFVGGYNYPYWQTNNNEAYHNTNFSVGNNISYSSILYTRIRKDDNTNLVVSGGNYVSIIGLIQSSSVLTNNASTNIGSQPLARFGISSDNSHTDCGIIDYSYNEHYAASTNSPYQYRYTFEAICRVQSSGTTNPVTNLFLSTSSAASSVTASMNIQRVTIWRASEGFDDDAIVAAINTTNARLNTIINLFNSANGLIGVTNNKLDDMLDGISGLNSLQQEANDDANDRYQDEKDTINNAADDAQSNASGQDFSFSIPNPLQSWFGGFSDNECVNIPNLAVWLHSNETRICTPWPSSVRSVVTTVVTGMFMLLLFGFIISWVKKNDTGGN